MSYSQTTSELEHRKEKLEEKKDSLKIEKDKIDKNIKLLERRIDSIADEINFSQIREKAIITTVKRDSKILISPYSTSEILISISKNHEVLVIEYYKYGDYYKVICENNIGYVKEKNLRVNNNIKRLKLESRSEQNQYTKSSITPRKKLKRTNYRTYYRGPRGGCYYINSNGNKSYVSRTLCN